MLTCGENFSHIIKDSHTQNQQHHIVKHGIYAYLRHPSYFGWFYWSLGTQLLLCNPICFIFYTYATWQFFANRIPYEEDTLVEIYGEEYAIYAQSTLIGIPFIPTSIQPLTTIGSGTDAGTVSRYLSNIDLKSLWQNLNFTSKPHGT